ncbi:MAG: outer membrane protein assembly factor BamE [Alphaproteobacteria bacterium]
MRWFGRRRLTVISLTLALAACSPAIHSRGYVPDEEALATLEPGQSNRADVSETLGSPSAEGTFDKSVWYYVSERTETVAFLRPKVIERTIVAVTFDDTDRVEDIFTYTKADGKPVKLISRVTPTSGNELTILQQLFGNLGRFNN